MRSAHRNGVIALVLAGILYGSSTEPLASVLTGGVNSSAFLSIRFAFAARQKAPARRALWT